MVRVLSWSISVSDRMFRTGVDTMSAHISVATWETCHPRSSNKKRRKKKLLPEKDNNLWYFTSVICAHEHVCIRKVNSVIWFWMVSCCRCCFDFHLSTVANVFHTECVCAHRNWWLSLLGYTSTYSETHFCFAPANHVVWDVSKFHHFILRQVF